MADEEKLRAYLKRATADLAETRKRLAESEARHREPIAVVGMACRFPGAPSVDRYWDLLVEGRSGVLDDVPGGRYDLSPFVAQETVYTTCGAFLPDVAGWDAEFFGIPPREALRMDPQQRLLMELAWEAFEDAGTPPPKLAGTRTAVMVGFSDPLQYARVEQEHEDRPLFEDPYAGQGASASVVAGRLAYHFDLRGPTLTLDTACSSSLVVAHLAANALRRAECDLALVGGAFLALHTDMYVNACSTNMLSRDGRLKTFDARADGYVLGEGAGLVVLERLSDALRRGHRVRAVIRGSAVNQDGRSNGLTAPNRAAQVDVIRRALAAAGAAPADVAYVEAHGSGTKLGDAIELGALGDVFGGPRRERPVYVGAVKTNLGHTQAAAGVAGLIKTVLVLEHGSVPPNLNLAEPSETLRAAQGVLEPATRLQPLPSNPDPQRAALAAVSSFGWCGTNAHLVLSAAPATDDAPRATDRAAVASARGEFPELLPVSAGSQTALAQRMADLAESVESAAFADVVHTLQSGRAELEYRCAVLAASPAEAAARLSGRGGNPGVRTVRDRVRLAFLLPGVGDQYRGLGQGLYRDEPEFAEAVDRCVRIAAERCGVDLRPALFGRPRPAQTAATVFLRPGQQPEPGEDGEADDRAVTSHLFLFTVEYALARLFERRGVRPDLLIGYSLGEYVAACLAGVFALEDALWVVSERARLIEAAPDGRMLAVAAGADQVRGVLADDTGAEADVGVAAVNGPTMTVVSGTPTGIAAAAGRFAEAGIAARPLRSAHPFHSSLLAPAREKLAAVVASVPRQAPRIRILSNATGAPLSAEQATDPWYWADHLTHPVLFAAAIQSPAARDVDAFVELGAGQMLGGLVRQTAQGGEEAAVLGTLPAQWQANSSPDERTALLETTGRLWELGVELNWAAVRSADGKLIALPAYPFQRERFWPTGPARSGAAPLTGEEPAAEPFTGPAAADHCYAPTWRRDVTSAAAVAPGESGYCESRFPAGSLLVFSDGRHGAGASLAAQAAASGMYVLEVLPGTGFRRDGTRVEIDPAEPEHYRRVCAELGTEDTGVVHVAHLWSLLDPGRAPVFRDEAELRTAIRHGYDSVLMAVQALGSTVSNRDVRLLTVTAGAAEVLGGDCPSPDRALAHGFGRAVQAEYPWLSWRGLDLDPTQEPAGPGADRFAARIAAELREGPDMVAWRGGRRWLKGWEQVPLPGDASAPAPYRADGVYLITGGTRGLGLGLARHLVRHGVRRLALVGRTDLRTSAAAEPDGRAAQSLRQIAALEAAGAQILLLTADAGVPEDLRAAFRSCRDRFGALTGVFHAAGVQAGGMAYRQSIEGAARTLAPKVLAMGPLAELVGPAAPAHERPELLVLYSSAVTVFGGIGESDYCAANSVLDAYGAALADLAPSTRVLAVAWGPWQHDDWQADGPGGTFADRVRAHRRTYGFDEADGCVLLDRLVAGARGGVVALRQSLAEGRRQWDSIIDLDTVATTGTRGGGETARAARFPRPRLRTEYAAPQTEVEALVADSWGHHLGIDRVGVHDPFFELGGNSLIGLAMVADVGRRLDRAIAPAVLFEHPTVAEFAAAVAGAPADPGAAGTASGGSPGPSSRALGSARGERRRRGRAAAGTATAPASPAN